MWSLHWPKPWPSSPARLSPWQTSLKRANRLQSRRMKCWCIKICPLKLMRSVWFAARHFIWVDRFSHLAPGSRRGTHGPKTWRETDGPMSSRMRTRVRRGTTAAENRPWKAKQEEPPPHQDARVKHVPGRRLLRTRKNNPRSQGYGHM